MRGDAQDVDIDYKVIDAVLDQVDNIGQITLTGGEPTLNLPAIKYLVEGLKSREKTIGSFYIKTNGAKLTLELAITLMELYALCNGSEYEPGVSACGLEISHDQFHWGSNEIHPVFKALKFFLDSNENKIEDPRFQSVILEGRAADLGIGQRSPEEVAPFYVEDYGDSINVDTMYIGETGDVVSLCDISYNRFEEQKQGNILETPLLEIVQTHSNHEEKEEAA